jgi:hypothetical protein
MRAEQREKLAAPAFFVARGIERGRAARGQIGADVQRARFGVDG